MSYELMLQSVHGSFHFAPGEQYGRARATSRIWQSSPCILLPSLQLNLATAVIALRRLFMSRRSHLLIWCIVFPLGHPLQSFLTSALSNHFTVRSFARSHIAFFFPSSATVSAPSHSLLGSSLAFCLRDHNLIQSSLATAGHCSFHTLQLSLSHSLIPSSVLPSSLTASTWTPTLAYCVHLACLRSSLYHFFARAKLCMSGLEVKAGSEVLVGSKD